jgi:hypothetical protein
MILRKLLDAPTSDTPPDFVRYLDTRFQTFLQAFTEVTAGLGLMG